MLGGAALASLLTVNPLPLLVWFGSELVLLPVLDSGPLRRLVHRRRRAAARAQEEAAEKRLVSGLSPRSAKRYVAMEQLCQLIEANYRSLSGISQAYLSEQRGKLDSILRGCLHRMLALERYDRMPQGRTTDQIEQEIQLLEVELAQQDLPERATAALRKNVELKRRLLASIEQVGDTVRTLFTELDSMESLLEVLHQNSISLRDPQAISEELDTIVRQSEDSERIVREMEAMLGTDTGSWHDEVTPDRDMPVPAGTAPIAWKAPKVQPPAIPDQKRGKIR